MASISVNDVLYPFDAVLCAIALAYKLPSLRHQQRDPATLSLCLAFAFLGSVFTLATPAVWKQVDQISGVTNLTVLLSQSGVIAYTACIEAMLLFWLHPRSTAWRKLGWRLGGFGIVLTIMVALFALTRANEQRQHDFVAHYMGVPTYSMYLLVYLAAFAFGKIDILRLSAQYAPLSESAWLRRGLRFIGAGAVLGLIYVTARAAGIAGVHLGVDPHIWEIAAQLGSGIGAIVTLIGMTLPSWGPRLSPLTQWVEQYRAYHHLHALWSPMYKRNPEIALEPPASQLRDSLSIHGISYRLGRRFVEINDARMILSKDFSSQVEDVVSQIGQGRGLAGEDLEIALEAAQIAVALQRTPDSTNSRQLVSSPQTMLGYINLQKEVSRLVKVSRAFRTSDIVSETVAVIQQSDGIKSPSLSPLS